ncbi:hypothetical protein [uncultured Bilophila sp.]|uniref:hypothetical protein n=1 Tax=uncultured Bilophila sp. TaxID=529385 RepID=UPI0026700009|nr:hypothetical protein [uncultured Bilophila sp.]
MAEISSVIQHASLTGDNIHVAYAGTYADETARLAAKLDASMEGKLYRQISDNTLWMLVSSVSKTWISLGKDTAKYLGNGGDDDDPMTFHWDKKSGQPSQVWGGSDGKNMYVYNPANFNVNSAKTSNSASYANSAGSVSSLGGAIVSGVVRRCGDEICVFAPEGGQYLILYDQVVEVTKGYTSFGGELTVSLKVGLYTGGANLGHTANNKHDDEHMLSSAGILYRT